MIILSGSFVGESAEKVKQVQRGWLYLVCGLTPNRQLAITHIVNQEEEAILRLKLVSERVF